MGSCFLSTQFKKIVFYLLVVYVYIGISTDLTTTDSIQEEVEAGKSGEESNSVHWDAFMTPAERRYVEQRERIDQHRLAKTANKSHRDRIQDFNQYLANMSEHYDIPKVGPG